MLRITSLWRVVLISLLVLLSTSQASMASSALAPSSSPGRSSSAPTPPLGRTWDKQDMAAERITRIPSGEEVPPGDATPQAPASLADVGIYGHLLANGTPVANMPLELRQYNSSADTSVATATTDANGYYLFTNTLSLPSGYAYYVRFGPNTTNPAYVSAWYGPDVTAYTAGQLVFGGDLEIADISLQSPPNNVTTSLPATFTWSRRNATSDSYRWYMADTSFTQRWRTGPLGYVNQFTLTNLPSGAAYDTPYCWYVAVSEGSSGSGYSFYCRLITYSSVGTSNGLEGGTVYALAIDPATPSTLYAGTGGGGVFKSTNGGAAWSAVNTGLTSTVVNALAIDPVTPSTLYAGTRDGGVFKSTNAGANWSAVNTGVTNGYIHALAIDPATPATLYAGTQGGGVFKSTNGGGNWSVVDIGTTNPYVWALAIDPETPATLYTGTGGGGVFKSTNGGAYWSATGLTNRNVYALAIDPATPTTLYAGTLGGVFKSTNGGGNWNPVSTGLPPDPFWPSYYVHVKPWRLIR